MQEQKKGVPVWVWLLAIIPVAVAAIGILSAVAIYGVRKYVVTAKTAEAQATLTRWGGGLAQCGEREGRLPESAKPVPLSLADVKGRKYQASPGEWTAPAHRCAGFSFAGPQYFQYRWERQSDVAGALYAVADLDADAAQDIEVRLDVTCAAGRCAADAPVTVGAGVATGHVSPAAATSAATSGMSAGQIAALALIGLCVLVNSAASIWLLVLSFQESVKWGLLCLFVPCAQIVFAIQFWHNAKRPALLHAGALGALLVACAILVSLGGASAIAAPSPTTGAASVAPALRPPHTGPGVRLEPPPPLVPVPELTGAPVDLSTVMGKARKLANQWDEDAALVGIEATLVSGLIQTAAGGTAKLTFGPSPFSSVTPKTGSYVVTYDKSGMRGVATKTAPGKALPEPMCAPETVYAKMAAEEAPTITLRYGFEAAGRAAWVAQRAGVSTPRLFEPQRCDPMGIVAGQRMP